MASIVGRRIMAMAAVEFAKPASDATLEALAERMRARNFEVVIVDDGAAAKAEVLSPVPEGSPVHSGNSKTLEAAGIFHELMPNHHYNFIPPPTTHIARHTPPT